MKVALLLKDNMVSNPVDSDRCIVVDISLCCKPIKIVSLPRKGDGISKLSHLAFKLVPSGVKGIVVSKIGEEGFKAVRELGLRVYRFEGSLTDLENTIRSRGFDLEEINEKKIDINCPCCQAKRA